MTTSHSEHNPIQMLQPEIEHILDMLLNDQDTRRLLDDLAERHGLERPVIYRATNIVRRFRRQRSSQ